MPVMDMRLKLGIAASERTVDTCIVIVDADLDNERVTIGCMVDSVQEVLEMSDADIELPPKMGMRLRTDFIQGMGRQEDGFIIILNIDKILSADELLIMQNANAPRKNIFSAEAAGPELAAGIS